ncbi:hypothetical protein H671_3g11232 [Cricetulus griseus]|nr:hypothetical protein H671_3g11232 [Cricetulus griseus]
MTCSLVLCSAHLTHKVDVSVMNLALPESFQLPPYFKIICPLNLATARQWVWNSLLESFGLPSGCTTEKKKSDSLFHSFCQ